MARRLPAVPTPVLGEKSPVKECADTLRFITAQGSAPIQKLPSSATLAQAVDKINEIITRLQVE